MIFKVLMLCTDQQKNTKLDTEVLMKVVEFGNCSFFLSNAVNSGSLKWPRHEINEHYYWKSKNICPSKDTNHRRLSLRLMMLCLSVWRRSCNAGDSNWISDLHDLGLKLFQAIDHYEPSEPNKSSLTRTQTHYMRNESNNQPTQVA